MDFWIFILASLFLFWTLFGSFSSVLISRWKHKEKGIISGRSHCPKCGNTLGASELIPIFSYLFQWGKCKHCKARIPKIYPILELCMGAVFLLLGYAGLYIFSLDVFSVAFFFLLFFGFLTVVYIFYDILYTEIPDQVYVLFIVWFFILFILSFFTPYNSLYCNAFQFSDYKSFIFDKIFGATILYSFLYFQIFISGSIYFIQKKRYKDIWELFLLYFLFPFISIWDFIKHHFIKKADVENEEEEEIPLWVWPGDLFIAIIIGLMLGVKVWIVAFFLAYCIGSIYGVISLLAKKWRASSQIPFWPFLGIGSIMAIILTPNILLFINNFFFY